MCAMGATRSDLADRFGVNVSTIDAWIFEHEVFSQACKTGQDEADDRVEASYYERAVGYTYDSEKVLIVDGEVIHEPIKVYMPPDPRCGEFWMRNRRPDRWKDSKQLETRVADDDPLLAYLKSIDGRVLRPVEQDEPAIEVEYAEVKSEQDDEDGPPRPTGGPQT
jgi:transposase-like protein